MLESLMNSFNGPPSPDQVRTFQHILTALLLSSAFSWLTAWVYTIIRRETGYARSFVQTLIMVSVIVTAVMAIIGNDLARAFGLVGAVSIIRFRTKVKDPLDTAFLFSVIAIGMANGLGLYTLSFMTTAFVLFLIFLMHWLKFGHTAVKELEGNS